MVDFNKEAELFYKFQKEQIDSGILFPNTWFELDWVQSWNFSDDIQFKEPHFRNTYRRYFLSQAAKNIENRRLDGDFVEFGVYYGYGSKILLNNSKKILHIIDSFEGLSEPGLLDGNDWVKGEMSVSVETVLNNLKDSLDRLRVHKGVIPQVLENLVIDKISLAHIDVDLYEPTIHSLTFCLTRLVRGGIIICDDYGFTKCPGATAACEEVLKKFPNFTLLPLPVGGCLIQEIF